VTASDDAMAPDEISVDESKLRELARRVFLEPRKTSCRWDHPA
jgi:hypothetical protein